MLRTNVLSIFMLRSGVGAYRVLVCPSVCFFHFVFKPFICFSLCLMIVSTIIMQKISEKIMISFIHRDINLYDI